MAIIIIIGAKTIVYAVVQLKITEIDNLEVDLVRKLFWKAIFSHHVYF